MNHAEWQTQLGFNSVPHMHGANQNGAVAASELYRPCLKIEHRQPGRQDPIIIIIGVCVAILSSEYNALCA